MYPLLDTISTPSKLRSLERKSLPQLADELRQFLVESVAKTGGHLSSNLGTVELTIALHYVFNTPHDRLVWDVGHQTYAHKILTGRRGGMDKLRMQGGIAGFPRRDESEYDPSDILTASKPQLPEQLSGLSGVFGIIERVIPHGLTDGRRR